MITHVTEIIKDNHIILLEPTELLPSLNRDTQITYVCIECNTSNQKSVRNFCKNILCRTCIINNKPVEYEKSLKYLKPDVAKLFHPYKNKKTAKDYTISSIKKVWWLCPIETKCGCLHEFEANICDMVKCNSSKSKGCPFCTTMGSNKKFCLHNSLFGLFPDLYKYWSTKNLKTPDQYLPHSEEEVLWNCHGCINCGKKHEYLQKISVKTGKKRNGEIRANTNCCIICQPYTQYICDCQQLKNTYPQLYEECDIEKNKIEYDNFDINSIPVGSNLNLWWICSKNSQHKWLAVVNNRTHGSGCPYCNYDNTSLRQTIPIDKLIEQLICIHDSQYEYPYIKDEYVNSSSCITILHKKCGSIHEVNVGHHKNSLVGCQNCNKRRRYSQMAINYLKFMSKLRCIEIQHAENGGEHKIENTRYRADGYCKETNTIYEFHGTIYHGHPILNYGLTDCNYLGKNYTELYEKTLEREKLIKDLGYNLVVMWEHEWLIINKSIKALQKKIISKNRRLKC